MKNNSEFDVQDFSAGEIVCISAILVYSLIEFEDLILICDFVQKLSAKN